MSQNAPRLKKERMDLFFNKEGRKKSRADERKKSEFCRAFALHIKQKKEKREIWVRLWKERSACVLLCFIRADVCW